MLTEREWQDQYIRQSRRPDWYGPQCVMCTKRSNTLRRDRSFLIFLLILSCLIAGLLPVFVSEKESISFSESIPAANIVQNEPREIQAIQYGIRWHGEWADRTYTKYELNSGNMLLLNEKYHLPADRPPPNTYRIASQGRGMIPVKDLHIKSGYETIEALQNLFEALRQKGVTGLIVSNGTQSTAQQREEMLWAFRKEISTQSLNEGLEAVLAAYAWPGTGEMLLEYCVEIQQQEPNTMALEILRQTAWRFGFVQTLSKKPDTIRLRYVGKAHATAMTYLDLDLESYLLWLHQKGELTVMEADKPKYLILCKPLTGTHVQFSLPLGAAYEASADNMGYAIVACTLS